MDLGIVSGNKITMTDKTIVGGIEFSEADIQALKGGQQIGGSSKTGFASSESQTFSPTASYSISSGKKNVRPKVRDVDGNQANRSDRLVTAPDMSKNNTLHAAEVVRIQEEKAAKDAEQLELRAFMNPERLQSEVQYLQRTVKRMDKALKALQKDSNATA